RTSDETNRSWRLVAGAWPGRLPDHVADDAVRLEAAARRDGAARPAARPAGDGGADHRDEREGKSAEAARGDRPRPEREAAGVAGAAGEGVSRLRGTIVPR